MVSQTVGHDWATELNWNPNRKSRKGCWEWKGKGGSLRRVDTVWVRCIKTGRSWGSASERSLRGERSKQRVADMERPLWSMMHSPVWPKGCTRGLWRWDQAGHGSQILWGWQTFLTTLAFTLTEIGSHCKDLIRGVTWSELNFRRITLDRKRPVQLPGPRLQDTPDGWSHKKYSTGQ